LKIDAIGLNRAEVMFSNGAYLETPAFPAHLGGEAAGIVDKVGAGVTGLKPGGRVSTVPSFSMSSHGVYGEEAVVPAHAVARNPAKLSAAEGASIWTQYLTVWGALVHYGKVRAEQDVLITAASSSVGLAAIEVTRLLGARAIAVTRAPAKKKALLEAGAAHVIASAEEDLPQASPITNPAVVATWSLSNTSSGKTANTPGASSFEVRFTCAASHGGVAA
jgi:NADPH:quinone reductase-like Zn-dependent oxidoreductase